jgi:two-component system chemotaxis sensor kinase CheA
MTIDMSQFYQVFFDEADELLADMEKLLLDIDVSGPDSEDLNAIFRAAHSIKGGAATFGFADITDVTHLLESLLDRIRKGEMALTADHVDAFLVAKDVLDMLMEGHHHGKPVDDQSVASIGARLKSLSLGEVQAHAIEPEPAPAPEPVTAMESGGLNRFRIELPELAQKDIDALTAELGLLGEISQQKNAAGRVTLTLATTETQDTLVAICAFVLDPDDLVVSRVAAAAAPASSAPATALSAALPVDSSPTPPAPVVAAAPTAEAKPPARRASDKEESTSIRVGVEKVDQLINLVGELVITQAMIEQRISALDPIQHERLLNSASQLARNTRDLQEAVMSIRMMPMDYVFSRFPRMVRDLAGKLGKKIEFVTHGAATELDKGLIERIIDPLTHLVRNSVDHGIEMPEARRAAGKSDTGKLTLSAAHQGGNIVIEVIDDGAGLSRERILAKARQQGLPVSDSMPDNEVWLLIFAPGFSTAEVVTDVSGRGVGMDVVRRNISAMGGTVDIRSTPGRGSTIAISLPLTLAILDGMSVKVGDETYILPLGHVLELLQPAAADLRTIAGEGRVVRVREEYLPLIPLHQVFAIEPTFTDPSQGIIVIIEADSRKAALLVDGLGGQQQVVVKNLESNFRKVAGISGATILGDGKVALIIDAGAMVRNVPQLMHETA